MEFTGREALEQEIRRHHVAGAMAAAAVAALRGYGTEILSFLTAIHKDETAAAEVFSSFCEGMWTALPGFSWHSSFRTWAYCICRNQSHSYRRDARRRVAREGLRVDSGELCAIAQQLRTQTLPYLRTEQRSRIVALREELPLEDQEVLILRVDRQLSWEEIAQVMHAEGGAPLAGPQLKREAARLRKRFQGAKEKLREMALRAGLIKQDDER